ncbi:MAG TPA: tRNA (N(6)-L-threonylcarbamoyladenosine(37)-C(2))-methylthiotransferase MtaB [Anaerolineales bacterium]
MKIFLDTIGCRLNQAEIESLALQFRAAGHEIVPSATDADLSVINTCTVTAKAASDSRAAIRRTKRLGTGSIVVTGCWATLEPEKAIALPGVTCVVPNLQKNRLAAVVLGSPQDFFNLEHLARQPLPGLHQRTRAFIKAQDGCDNTCTFCITTVARGASRSRPVEDVLLDVQGALNGGTKEIVLTGVQLGAWGHDLTTRLCLSDLVSELLALSSVPRLRMSSLEPWDLEVDFFRLWSDPHLCRHLHLPLQSGSASVLKRMARKTTPDDFAGLVASARSVIPEVAITTDLITGFPGETDTEFVETMEFVKAMGFTGGHVFPYSARPGTPAARMKGQVHNELAKKRGAELRSILAKSAKDYRRKFIGRTMSVLWEARSILTDSGWQIEGLTDNFIRVVAFASEPKWNHIDKVLLRTEGPEYLIGEILK